MGGEQFDRLVLALGRAMPRRGVVAILGGLASVTVPGLEAVGAGHRHRNHRQRRRRRRRRRTKATLCLPQSLDLQGAIDRASPGVSLRLCAGTWALTKAIHIGHNQALVGAGPGYTILDGTNGWVVVGIAPGAIVTLQGLTITNGHGNNGGGIFNQGTLRLVEVEVTGNTVESAGGGIMNLGTLTLEAGTSVRGNSALEGGGIYSYGMLTLQDGSSVAGNTARIADGGGILNYGGTVTLNTGSSVTGNTAQGTGGGIDNFFGALTLRSGSSVTNNTATLNGGGIFNQGAFVVEPGANVSGNVPNQCSGLPPTSGSCLLV